MFPQKVKYWLDGERQCREEVRPSTGFHGVSLGLGIAKHRRKKGWEG